MNFHDYLNRQNNEDRRAFIIHYPALSGKTRFAEQVCAARSDAHRLDLLDTFLHRSDIGPTQQCSFDVLRKIMLSLVIPEVVILVDNGDFLFNTWNQAEKDAFQSWLRIGLRSPRDTEKTFIFLLQSDPWFTASVMKNSYGEDRILALNAFDALL